MGRVKKTKNALVFEELEPRLLFSADMGEAFIADAVIEDYAEEPVVMADLDADVEINSGAVDQPGEEDTTASQPQVEQADSEQLNTVTASSLPANQEEDTVVDTAENSPSKELVFVNDNVSDYQQLVDDLQQEGFNRDVEVVILDNEKDGLNQVTETLQAFEDLDAIHFLTHGSDARINLGNDWLDSDSLQENRDLLATWEDSLSDTGDILFYGCGIASDGFGQALLDDIAELTSGDVAASNDLTGDSAQGGDWDLEYQIGEIETGALFSDAAQNSWDHLLNVVADNTSTGTSITDSLTISHTTSGTDRLMLVGVSLNKGTGTAVTSISYNGDALELVGSSSNGDAVSEIWMLINPDLGTYDVNILLDGTTDGNAVGVMTFTGVDQCGIRKLRREWGSNNQFSRRRNSFWYYRSRRRL